VQQEGNDELGQVQTLLIVRIVSNRPVTTFKCFGLNDTQGVQHGHPNLAWRDTRRQERRIPKPDASRRHLRPYWLPKTSESNSTAGLSLPGLEFSEPKSEAMLIGHFALGPNCFRPTRGGEVIITDNDKNEMDRFAMRECGECYVFDDDRIWHMLTPVAVLEGNQYDYRDTLAFDMLRRAGNP